MSGLVIAISLTYLVLALCLQTVFLGFWQTLSFFVKARHDVADKRNWSKSACSVRFYVYLSRSYCLPQLLVSEAKFSLVSLFLSLLLSLGFPWDSLNKLNLAFLSTGVPCYYAGFQLMWWETEERIYNPINKFHSLSAPVPLGGALQRCILPFRLSYLRWHRKAKRSWSWVSLFPGSVHLSSGKIQSG